MANRHVNDKQRKVLDWLAAGGSVDPPEPEMKLSAAALKARGLVKVRRPSGKWTAELTETGRYYVEHGDYPDTSVRAPAQRQRRPAVKRRASTSQVVSTPKVVELEHQPSSDPEDEVPIKELIVKPHPAVRELRDRPRRLPKFAQRRCQLIAHTLVTEALARGWEVTAVPTRKEADHLGKSKFTYEHSSLFFIDAGHCKVGFIFDEKQTRIDHVDTAEEAAKRAKGQYVWAPRYDYLSTGLLRLHFVTDGGKDRSPLVDGPRARIEDKIAVILARVEKASTEAVAAAERRRAWQEEWDAKERERERIAELRRGYEKWEAALHSQADAWARHRDLVAFVEAVAALPDEQRNDAFVEWAKAHLDALDPRLRLPDGDQPGWTHEQRARNGRLSMPQQPAWMNASYR